MDTQQIGTTAYDQLIDQGQKLARVDFEAAIILYQEAQSLTQDKFDTYVLQAQARSANGYQYLAFNNLINALDHVYEKKDRLLLIANEFQKLQLKYIPMYIHGLIKQFDSNYDHYVPETYDDYENIFVEFFQMKEVNYPIAKLIDKLIQLSQIKQGTFLLIGQLILKDSQLKPHLLQQAEHYFKLAMSINDGRYDEHDILIRIGNLYLEIIPDISIKYFEMALEVRPNIFHTHIRIVQAKIELSQFKQAFEYIKNKQIPNEREIYLVLGILFNKQETYREGLEFILKAVDLSENKFDSLVEIADHVKLESTDIKKTLLKMAIDIDGDHLQTLIKYAKHLFYNQEYTQEMLNVINKVLQLDPQQKQFYYYQYHTLTQLGRRDEAIQQLKKALDIFQDYQLLELLGMQLLEQNKVEESVKYLEMALFKNPYSQYKIVKLFFEKNLPDECIQFCDKFITYGAEYWQFMYKGLSLFKIERKKEAIRQIQMAEDRCDQTQLVTLGSLLLQNQHLELAVKYFKMALKQKKHIYLQGDIVKSLFMSNHFEECIQFCEEYIQFNQIPEIPLLYQAKSLSCLKRYKESLFILQKLIDIGTTSNQEVKEYMQLKQKIMDQVAAQNKESSEQI